MAQLSIIHSNQSRLSEVVLEFLDSSGKSIQKFTAKPAAVQPSPATRASPAASASTISSTGTAEVTTPPEEPQAPSGEESKSFGGGLRQPRLTTDVGLNRFVWNLRYQDAVRFPGIILWAGDLRGPRVVPGMYQVRLMGDGKTLSETLK